jgi:hypothetical protein
MSNQIVMETFRQLNRYKEHIRFVKALREAVKSSLLGEMGDSS